MTEYCQICNDQPPHFRCEHFQPGPLGNCLYCGGELEEDYPVPDHMIGVEKNLVCVDCKHSHILWSDKGPPDSLFGELAIVHTRECCDEVTTPCGKKGK